ncbi:MAG: DUF4926 domain-containing protein [Chloroflexi bacterium]|nr:DUF4926 domain-containing protein [Chloroflexota bacterium]
MFKLVRLKCNIPIPNLTKEQQDAIVLLFTELVPVFEVEFSDHQGRIIAELALTKKLIRSNRFVAPLFIEKRHMCEIRSTGIL